MCVQVCSGVFRYVQVCSGEVNESRGGLVGRTHVHQSKRPQFKSRCGQIAYFRGVKTGLSTL